MTGWLVRVPSMGQVGLLKNYSYLIGEKKTLKNYAKIKIRAYNGYSLTAKHKITPDKLTCNWNQSFDRLFWVTWYHQQKIIPD